MSANFNPDTKNVPKLNPFKGWVYERFPFIQEDFDSLTSYELWCKIVEYVNKISESVNINADNNNELVDAYSKLQDYVNNYFNNLDVQEEINNKLDAMVIDGTMDQIINQEIFGQLNDAISSNTSAIVTLNETTIPGINEDIDGIESSIETINTETIPNAVEMLESELSQKYTDIPRRLYIDGVNGDDENDGSSEYPLKTLDAFFEKLNHGVHDLRCYIVSSGTYQVSKSQFLDCTIHITANTSGVVIEFSTDNYVSFYNTHISINSASDSQPLTLRYSKGVESMTIENTSAIFQNVIFSNITCGLYGTYVRMTNCSIYRMYLNGSKVSSQHTRVLGLADGVGFVCSHASDLVLYGSFDVTGSTHTSNIINLNRSTGNILISSTTSSSNLTSGNSIYLEGSLLITNTTALGILNGLASGGYTHVSSSILNTAYKELQ